MRVRFGTEYEKNDAIAVIAAVLDEDGEIETVINTEQDAIDSGKVTERGMYSAALISAVDGLRTLNVPRKEIMRLAENIYMEGAQE